MKYADWITKTRSRFHPKAAGRADYEARVEYHQRKARSLLADARHLWANVPPDTLGSWQATEASRLEAEAKGHKRQAIYLLRAGNRGEPWNDSTPARALQW